MKKKRYDGYTSFQYLDAGVDYKAFELVPELNRVPSRQVEVDAAQAARVQRIFERHLVISLHDHCFVAPKDLSAFLEFRRWGREFTGYAGLAVSGLDCVFDAMMDGTAMITSRAGWKWEDVIFDIGMRLSDIAHQDMVKLALTTDDIRAAKRDGRIAFVVSLEGAAMIENELDRIDVLYGLGMRSLGIAYSEGNALGAGLKEPAHFGLTSFGRRAVRRMNQLGIAIDISHANDATSMDTIEASSTRSSSPTPAPAALWDSPRLKPDEVIRACASKGGVIGIEAAPHTTITGATSAPLDRVVHGALRVLRRPGRHRPRRLRPRRAVRRPRRPARRAARGPLAERLRGHALPAGASGSTGSRTRPRPSPTSSAGS
jgi:membrane dipeptidase